MKAAPQEPLSGVAALVLVGAPRRLIENTGLVKRMIEVRGLGLWEIGFANWLLEQNALQARRTRPRLLIDKEHLQALPGSMAFERRLETGCVAGGGKSRPAVLLCPFPPDGATPPRRYEGTGVTSGADWLGR